MLPFQISASRWGEVSRDSDTSNPEKHARSKGVAVSQNAVFCKFVQNDAGTCRKNWRKIDTNDFEVGSDQIKKNPDALAGAVEVNIAENIEKSRNQHCLSREKFAREYPILAEHWGDDLAERAERAVDALSDLEPWQAEMVAAQVIDHAGAPLPPFLGGMDDARFWASMATRSECKAYALASYEAMPATDQAAFIAHVTRPEQRGAAA